MTKAERVAAALARRPVDRPPVAFWRHVPEVDHTAPGTAGQVGTAGTAGMAGMAGTVKAAGARELVHRLGAIGSGVAAGSTR